MNPIDYLRSFATRPRTPLEDRGGAFRALAEVSAAAVLISEDHRIRYANAAATTITGYRREELLSMPFWELADADFRETLQRLALARRPAATAAPARYEVRLRTKGGEVAWADLSAASIDWDARPALLVTAIDVTDRKLAEDRMRESERRMRDIIENVQLIAVLLDSRGEVSFANDYLLELSGYQEEQVVGRNWFDLFLPADKRDPIKTAHLERLRDGVVLPHDEFEILTARGERRYVSWNNTLLHDPDGVVIGTASIGTDVTERRRAEERLLHDALHDSLTGLPNRALFMDRLHGAVARLKRRPEYLLAVLFLDVDRFKVVNDSLGHAAGDQFLIQFSRAIGSTIRRSDHTLARLSGDEFAILLDDIASREDAERVLERISAALAQPIRIGTHEIFASVSIGVAFSGAEYERGEDLLRDADTAMYHAKTAGRARHQVFDASMHMRAVSRLKLEQSMRRALEKGEFALQYQPIVRLGDGSLAGFEALVRWDHPERGLITPYEFIHLAEETGLIHSIGLWTLREACRTLVGWPAPRPGAEVAVNVNLSGRQFSQPDLIQQVREVLAETGLPPQRLKLEITESVIMDNPEVAVAMLEQLKALGTRLCIDDFGTGYSSLAYLLRFPADTLKIDRSFVSALGRGGRHDQIVATIVSLGKSLEMDVVAEGVESPEQRDKLLALGCPYAQGYLFSRALDAARARALLAGEAEPGGG